MFKVWLIGVNIFRQLLRNRILSVLFMFALALAGITLFLADLGTEAEDRLSRDFGLLAMEWIGFFTVLLAQLVLLFEETELKTISILLVKPIRRWQYLFGKVVGSILLLGLNQLGVLAVVALLGWYNEVYLVDFQFPDRHLFLFRGAELVFHGDPAVFHFRLHGPRLRRLFHFRLRAGAFHHQPGGVGGENEAPPPGLRC